MRLRPVNLLKSLITYLPLVSLCASIVVLPNTGEAVLAQDLSLTLQPEAAQIVCNPFQSVCTSSSGQTGDDWQDVAPGIKWRSPGNQRKRNIVVIDLEEPGIKLELVYEAVDLGQSLFKRKTLSDLISDWNSQLRRSDSSLNFYAAINATGFDCENGAAGAKPSTDSILGIGRQPYGLQEPGNHFGGRCKSFFTYRSPNVDEHSIGLHWSSHDFPYVACDASVPEPGSADYEDFITAENYIRSQIQGADFAVGYDRTFLADTNGDGMGEYVARGGNGELKTAVGIGLDDATGQPRYLYLATWNEALGGFGDNLEEFANELSRSGADRAILLDGGASSQFLSLGETGFISNEVKDLPPGICREHYLRKETRKILNGIVVYHENSEISVPTRTRIAFVIDDTGSMGDEIDDAKETVYRKVNELTARGQRYDYHLLTYKDDVTYRGATEDDRVLKAWVSELIADGGGDCPENMLGALNEIAERAPNSNTWLMTDAGFHGTAIDVAATLYKLVTKRVTVHPIIYSWCFSAQVAGQTAQDGQSGAATAGVPLLGPEVMAQIAADTGGHYFPIASDDTQAATTILLNEMVTESDLTAARDTVHIGVSRTYTIPIDATAKAANFLLNTYSGYATLFIYDPAGSPVDREGPNVTYTELNNATYYQIDDPAPGVWRAVIAGEADYSFSTSGDSALVFDYLGDTSLAKEERVQLKAALTGPVATATFQLVNLDGTFVDQINLYDDGLHDDGAALDGVFAGEYTPIQEGIFRLRVRGVISETQLLASNAQTQPGAALQGAQFERIALEVIRVHSLNVLAQPQPLVVNDLALTYAFSVTNGGPTNDTFELTGSSSLNWADLTSVPAVLDIPAGATAQVLITVTVPPTTPFETTDETTLVAVSRLNPLINDADIVLTSTGAPTFTLSVDPASLDSSGHVQPGSTAVFDLSVQNTGSVPTQNATIALPIPDHTSFDSEQSAGWPVEICEGIAAGAECIISIPDLEPGATASLRFALELTDSLPSEMTSLSLSAAFSVDNLARSPITQHATVEIATDRNVFLPLITR